MALLDNEYRDTNDAKNQDFSAAPYTLS